MGLLRFLLALSVITAHTGPIFGSYLVGGKIAVQSFFIISGFYMSLIISQKYSGKKNSYKLFITNRILRIYPTYLIVLFLSIILSFFFLMKGMGGTFSLYKQYNQVLNPITLAYLIISNIFIVGMDLVMFLGIDITHKTFYFTSNYLSTNPQLYYFLLIPQAWTLSLELMFYFIAPFFVKRKFWVLFVLIIISLSLRFYIYHIGLHQEPWTNRFFPTELFFFS